MLHALTIDVEDYFQIHALSDVIDPKQWDSFESRVERNTHRILDLLDTCHRPRTTDDGHGPRPPRATFFILGWIAERYPDLVREIQSRGHEVACHGYAHQCIFNQTRDQFREDVRRAKGTLEGITGIEVVGYRAPTYSITRQTLWALDTLFQVGFRYDSSIFPIRHDYYGFPEAPRFPFYLDFTNGDLLSQFENPKYLDFSCLKASAPWPLTPATAIDRAQRSNDSNALNERSGRTLRRQGAGGQAREAVEQAKRLNVFNALRLEPDSLFVEFPMSTISFLGVNLPFSGGGYFRLFPYRYSRWAFKQMNETLSHPAIFYVHPWELDSETPRISGASRVATLRTYVNLASTESKLLRLLSHFEFASLASIMKRTPWCQS